MIKNINKKSAILALVVILIIISASYLIHLIGVSALNKYSSLIQAITTILLCILTAGYVVFTKRMLSLMHNESVLLNRAFVGIKECKIENVGDNKIDVRVIWANFGKVPAIIKSTDLLVDKINRREERTERILFPNHELSDNIFKGNSEQDHLIFARYEYESAGKMFHTEYRLQYYAGKKTIAYIGSNAK